MLFSAASNLIPQFTGKERDTKTCLDYFMARYFSSTQGRFTSPDPLLASARLTDPQTWNRYAYVRNDPVNMVDPDGQRPRKTRIVPTMGVIWRDGVGPTDAF